MVDGKTCLLPGTHIAMSPPNIRNLISNEISLKRAASLTQLFKTVNSSYIKVP